jgi:hypothetical protein
MIHHTTVKIFYYSKQNNEHIQSHPAVDHNYHSTCRRHKLLRHKHNHNHRLVLDHRLLHVVLKNLHVGQHGTLSDLI